MITKADFWCANCRQPLQDVDCAVTRVRETHEVFGQVRTSEFVQYSCPDCGGDLGDYEGQDDEPESNS